MTDLVDVEEVAVRSGTTAAWAAAGAPILGNGELGIDLDTHEVRIGDGVVAFADLPVSVGGEIISHYEASWAHGDFRNDPDIIRAGNGPEFAVQLSAVDDNGSPGVIGIRSLGLDIGIYFVSWGGHTGTPDTAPDPGDPVLYAQWSISWDNSVAGLAQTASTVAPINLTTDTGIVGAPYQATASMVVPVTDAEDVVSIEVSSPYGGVNSSFTGYLAITKIG